MSTSKRHHNTGSTSSDENRKHRRMNNIYDHIKCLDHFSTLNQDTTWTLDGIDIVKAFDAFRSSNLEDFSLARDGIADLRPGSKFKLSLPPHVASVISRVDPAPCNIYQKWPTLTAILERVFKANNYEDVALAVMKEDMDDPIAGSHYFTFHNEIPSDINERMAFTDFTWRFVRGALTMTRIESRSLKVLNRDLLQESKEVDQFSDRIVYSGGEHVYLAEASALYQPRVVKLRQDGVKLVRTMRDSWVSQVRSICREALPHRSMTVLGSWTYKDETKFWLMDFKGVFRLREFDSFVIPVKKHGFGRRMKNTMLSCLELAARVEEEIRRRAQDVTYVKYDERVELSEAVRMIESSISTAKRVESVAR
ncbi:hypothetical protein BGZ65_005627 [Modicella reniformis]|uniref:Uncharacterized protein n=1 Tax=Modicella reniformis TaxID=1440133 RepID=A0A9P6M8G1_9FUNG|nr:hypothetical protein BGZ65_005627 [Modicella reniformis]